MAKTSKNRIKKSVMEWLVAVHENMEEGLDRYEKSPKSVGPDIFLGTRACALLIARELAGKSGEEQLKQSIQKDRQRKEEAVKKALENRVKNAEAELKKARLLLGKHL